ncbi:hypothetical protein J2T17_002632 [Paenibacillus mucilaginosus]|uniref:hypothetical protein n=1 Tax=Paenibacillus mucilaginosus TaxID=61624 RepID=UPI003D24996F
MEQITIRFAQVSAVIAAIDAYTGRPAMANGLQVELMDQPWTRPVRKPDGTFVFVNMSRQRHAVGYMVRLRSPFYLEKTLPLDLSTLDSKHPVMAAALKPNTMYPFPPHAALVRCALQDAEGRPLDGIPVELEVLPPAVPSAILGKDAAAGSDRLHLTSRAGPLAPGDEFRLLGRGEDVPGEVCRIAEILPQGQAGLCSPLVRSYPRHTQLLPLVRSHSDRRGEAVLWIRTLRSRQVTVRFRAHCPEGVRREIVQEFLLKEREVRGLGSIRLV